MRKIRTSFILGDIRFDIDSNININIPALMEVEAPSIEKVMKGVNLLGYNKNDAKDWDFGQVKEYYKNRIK